jgi:DNA-binding GntR family transcriptional regulator
MASVSQSMGISLVETIRHDILTAQLKPRMKLTVKVLSELYTCGASPVREALNRLTSEGLVDRIDRRGFFVAGISADEFSDILFNRCFMESEALRLSIVQGDGAWEERVLIAHFRLAALKREARGPDGPRPNPDWEAAHRRFHMALVSACPSQILLETCEKLHELNNRYRLFARTVQGPARSVEGEHQRLCDLALARSSDGAVQALIEHYRQTGEAILNSAVAAPEIGLLPRVSPLSNGAATS